jgi:hypothetical protein
MKGRANEGWRHRNERDRNHNHRLSVSQSTIGSEGKAWPSSLPDTPIVRVTWEAERRLRV